jgi:cysteine desulfurase/selenocysteine lyase
LLVPQTSIPASPSVAPASSFYFLDAQSASPWSSASTFPPAGQAFSFPDVPALHARESAPDTTLSALTEDDLRAAPGQPGGSTTVFSANAPSSAQPPSVPDGAAIAGVEKTAAPAGLPAVPAVGEAFSFPGVPDLSSRMESHTAPVASPTGISPAVAPWNADLQFPTGEQFFSLPAPPDMRATPDIESAVASPAAETDLRKIAASLAGTSPLAAHVPAPAVPDTAPTPPPYFLETKNAADFAAQPRPPARSETFSLPNVPGAPPVPSETTSTHPRVPFPPAERMLTFVTDLSEAARASGSAGAPAELGNSAPATPRDSSELRSGAVPAVNTSRRVFDPHAIRRDFPVLQERVHGRPLIWLDNAATTQKPQAVIDRISYFYEHENSNIHRAAHTLAARATDAYESAREKVRRFLNAPSTKEIVFVRGTTEAINLAAQSWGRRHIHEGDEIVISWIEHHSNIVPWQLLCADRGARLRVAPVDDTGQVLLDEYEKLLNPRTRLVSITQVSNALGTILPVQEMTQMAHRHGARVLVDGAQAIAHMRVDVQALDCDFYVFSGHKIFAPTGIGVLYGKPDALAESPPWQGGGSMIADVTFEKSVYQPPPARFEAGTGNIADAVGLGAALDYLDEVGMENITRYEHDLLLYGTEKLRQVPGLRLIGTAREKAGVMSFVLDGYRTEDVGAALDREGIAVRAGHHCAQPSLRRFGLETTVRPSLALYNTYEDVDALVDALRRLQAWNERGPR